MDQHRLGEALASYDAAIALDPGYVSAHEAKGFLLLLAAEFEAGWREHEWRKASWDPARRLAPENAWSGEGALAGKRLFVHYEQGLAIPSSSYATSTCWPGWAPDLHLAVQAPLTRLLAAALPGVTFLGDGEAPPISTIRLFADELVQFPLPGRRVGDRPPLRCAFSPAVGRPRSRACWG